MKKENKLGLFSVVSTGVGLIVATSCLMSLGQGSGAVGAVFIVAIIMACVLNMLTAASLAELNALMPNLTGGLAQYTLAGLGPFVTLVTMVGGYLICNSLTAPAEGAMFALAMKEITGWNVPVGLFSVGLTLILVIANLYGVDMFAKIQGVVVALLIGSLVLLGVIGAFGLGTGAKVSQPYNLTTNWKDIISMSAAAFWLFIGVEFIIPVSKDVKNPKKNIPLGMFLSLGIICLIQIILVLGFHNYTSWEALATSDSPHILYGVNLLGNFGKVWIAIIAILAAISTQNSVINSIPKICSGMSKMNMLPEFFQKTNKQGAPYIGIILYGCIIMIIEATGLTGGDKISFLILTASVFWMISYVTAHIDLLVLRKRLPKAPRSFKVPFGPVLPVIGIVGTGYMILNISSNPKQRLVIWLLVAIIFVVLTVYAALWILYKMKMPMFQPVKLEKVMAMENPLYYPAHKALRKREKAVKA